MMSRRTRSWSSWYLTAAPSVASAASAVSDCAPSRCAARVQSIVSATPGG
jgi:hypothetical protein